MPVHLIASRRKATHALVIADTFQYLVIASESRYAEVNFLSGHNSRHSGENTNPAGLAKLLPNATNQEG